MRALAFVVLAAPAAADCAQERDFVLATLGANGADVAQPGQLFSGPTCRLRGLVIDQRDSVTIRTEEIAWSLEGVGASGFAQDVTLSISVENARFVPKVTDRWVAYLLAEQARRNTMDVDMRVAWQPEAGTASLTRFDVDFPGRNAVEMTAELENLRQGVLLGVGLNAISIRTVTLDIENTGFLDNLILPLMVDQVRTVPGEPRRVMDATLGEVADLVDTWPSAVFPGPSRAALKQMIEDGPVPWGRLSLALNAPQGVPLLRFLSADLPRLGAPETLAALFDGARITATYVSLDPE